MRKLLVLVALLAVVPVMAACSQEAKDEIAAGLETAAPTIEAAAESVSTDVASGLQTVAPTLEAVGTGAAEAVESTMNKVAALAYTWEWQGTLMNDGTERVPDDPSLYTIDIKLGKEIAIKADCNNAMAIYDETETGVNIALGPVTLAACDEESLSEAFLNDLGNVGSAFMDGDDLILELKMDSGSMRFSPAE